MPLTCAQLIDPALLAKLPEHVQELLGRVDRRRLLHDMFTGLHEIHSRNLGTLPRCPASSYV